MNLINYLLLLANIPWVLCQAPAPSPEEVPKLKPPSLEHVKLSSINCVNKYDQNVDVVTSHMLDLPVDVTCTLVQDLNRFENRIFGIKVSQDINYDIYIRMIDQEGDGFMYFEPHISQQDNVFVKYTESGPQRLQQGRLQHTFISRQILRQYAATGAEEVKVILQSESYESLVEVIVETMGEQPSLKADQLTALYYLFSECCTTTDTGICKDAQEAIKVEQDKLDTDSNSDVDGSDLVPLCHRDYIICNKGLVTGLFFDNPDFGECHLGEYLPEFNGLESLMVYDTEYIGSAEEILAAVASIESLHDVSIRFAKLDGRIKSDCTFLRYELGVLDLAFNNIVGRVPACMFSSLYKLVTLDLSSNQLSGEMPEVPEESVLRHVSLFNNSLSGNMPHFAPDSQLKHIQIGLNEFTGPLPHLPKTVELFEAQNNKFDGGIPVEYDHLPHLQEIVIADCDLVGGDIPENFFARKPNLRIVEFYSNNLIGELPQLYNSPNLEILNVRNNSISGSIPRALGTLHNLHVLDVSSNQLEGNLLDFGGGLEEAGPLEDSSTSLQGLLSFNISGNTIGGNIPEGFIHHMSSQTNASTRVFLFNDNPMSGVIKDFVVQSVIDTTSFVNTTNTELRCPDPSSFDAPATSQYQIVASNLLQIECATDDGVKTNFGSELQISEPNEPVHDLTLDKYYDYQTQAPLNYDHEISHHDDLVAQDEILQLEPDEALPETPAGAPGPLEHIGIFEITDDRFYDYVDADADDNEASQADEDSESVETEVASDVSSNDSDDENDSSGDDSEDSGPDAVAIAAGVLAPTMVIVLVVGGYIMYKRRNPSFQRFENGQI